VVYVQSNCQASSGRDDILRALQGLNVTLAARGACLNNGPQLPHGQSKREVIAQYKFCATMENSLTVDYVSEKMWDGLAAGCLHTLSGPDHLAALTPLTVGRSHTAAAVCTARGRSDENTAVGRGDAAARAAPNAAAWSAPAGVRPGASIDCPCRRASRFQGVSPWRASRTRVGICGAKGRAARRVDWGGLCVCVCVRERGWQKARRAPR
jgi:hypothetical protein